MKVDMGNRYMVKNKSSELEKRVDLISRAVCQGKGASQQRRSLLNKLKDKLTSRTPYQPLPTRVMSNSLLTQKGANLKLLTCQMRSS